MAFVSLTDLVYPVGTYYINANGNNMDTVAQVVAKFGGTGEKLASGKVLRSGADNSTGGADTVTLTINQIPSHSHNVPSIVTHDSGSTRLPSGSYYALEQKTNYSTTSTGGGEAHSNIPAYQTVQVFKRTA